MRSFPGVFVVAIVALSVLALSAGAPFGATLDGAEVEVCSSPAATIPDGTTAGPGDAVVEFIAVEEGYSIDDVLVSVDITHAFIGDLAMAVQSPAGTFIVLFAGDGEESADMAVTFSDSGAAYGSEDWTCACEVQPIVPDGMSAFDDELSNGDWIFVVQDFFPPDEGTLNEWCVNIAGCDLPPPVDFTCEAGATEVSLSWSNPEAADGLVLMRNGAEAATLDATATSYVDEALEPGVYVYQLVATNDTKGCDSPSGTCFATVGLTQSCVELLDSNTINFSQDPVVSTIEVTEAIVPSDVIVQVDITHTFAGDCIVDLANPDATTVTVFNTLFTAEADLHITFADAGVPHASDFLNCFCYMQPSGPGTMFDLVGKSAEGDWTLTVADTFEDDDGTLDNWCLGIVGDGSVDPGPTFIRGDSDGSGGVSGLVDGLFTLRFFFVAGSAAPPCREAADADGNGALGGLLDPLYTLRYFFSGGPAMPAPFPDCGPADEILIGCDEPTVCL